MTMTAQRGLLILALTLVAAGAVAGGWGAWHSKQLTGEWFGDSLPNSVATAVGLGMLAVVIGLILCCAYVVVVAADRTGLTRVLNAPVLADSHAVARAGRTILHVNHVWETVVGTIMLVIVVWGALHDPLTAAILGATATVVVVLYLVGKKRIKSE